MRCIECGGELAIGELTGKCLECLIADHRRAILTSCAVPRREMGATQYLQDESFLRHQIKIQAEYRYMPVRMVLI